MRVHFLSGNKAGALHAIRSALLNDPSCIELWENMAELVVGRVGDSGEVQGVAAAEYCLRAAVSLAQQVRTHLACFHQLTQSARPDSGTISRLFSRLAKLYYFSKKYREGVCFDSNFVFCLI